MIVVGFVVTVVLLALIFWASARASDRQLREHDAKVRAIYADHDRKMAAIYRDHDQKVGRRATQR